MASSTIMPATPSANVAGAGPSGAGNRSIRARKCSASRVYGPTSSPCPIICSYVVVNTPGGGASAGAVRRSSGMATRTRAVGVRDRHVGADTVDPRRPVRTDDARLDEKRSAIGRGALHQTGHARLHREVHDETVVGRHGSRRKVDDARVHRRELAERHPDLIDHLRSVRGQPTAALVGIRPPFGNFGVGCGEHRHVQHDQREARLADRAALHDATQQGLAGVVPELGADEVDDAGRLGAPRPGHALRRRCAPTVSRTARACRRRSRPRRSTAWVSGGVAIVTASTPGSANASAIDVHAFGTLNAPARSAVFFGSRPTNARTSKPALRSARTWVKHPKPVPTTTAPVTMRDPPTFPRPPTRGSRPSPPCSRPRRRMWRARGRRESGGPR